MKSYKFQIGDRVLYKMIIINYYGTVVVTSDNEHENAGIKWDKLPHGRIRYPHVSEIILIENGLDKLEDVL